MTPSWRRRGQLLLQAIHDRRPTSDLPRPLRPERQHPCPEPHDTVGQPGARELELACHGRCAVCITPGRKGFGRDSSIARPRATSPAPDGVNQYCVPAFTVPDNMTNNEIGWKTQWFINRVQFNGAVYQEVWSNAQTGFFDPQGGLGNLAFATNGPSYRVTGLRAFGARARDRRADIPGSAAWNSPSQTNSPYLIDNNPASATLRQGDHLDSESLRTARQPRRPIRRRSTRAEGPVTNGRSTSTRLSCRPASSTRVT